MKIKMNASCLICCASLLNAASTRNLTSQSSKKLKSMIKELLCRNEGVEDVEEYMKRSTMICKSKCFASLEKLIKLGNSGES